MSFFLKPNLGKFFSRCVAANSLFATFTPHTDSYAVLTAMRGFDRIALLSPDDGSQAELIAGSVQSGPKKKLTANHNTTVSAVAVLYKDDSGNMALNIYHNRFAKVPLQPEDLCGEHIYHFQMLEDESGWTTC